jgi:Ribonuclease G/E
MEDESKYVGFENKSLITCQKTAKGWEVINKLYQKRTLDGVNWEEEEVSFKSIQDSIEKAYTDTAITMNYFLKKVGGTLFNPDALKVREQMADGISETLESLIPDDNNILQ